jgi:hypothetical protein
MTEKQENNQVDSETQKTWIALDSEEDTAAYTTGYADHYHSHHEQPQSSEKAYMDGWEAAGKAKGFFKAMLKKAVEINEGK